MRCPNGGGTSWIYGGFTALHYLWARTTLMRSYPARGAASLELL